MATDGSFKRRRSLSPALDENTSATTAVLLGKGLNWNDTRNSFQASPQDVVDLKSSGASWMDITSSRLLDNSLCATPNKSDVGRSGCASSASRRRGRKSAGVMIDCDEISPNKLSNSGVKSRTSKRKQIDGKENVADFHESFHSSMSSPQDNGHEMLENLSLESDGCPLVSAISKECKNAKEGFDKNTRVLRKRCDGQKGVQALSDTANETDISQNVESVKLSAFSKKSIHAKRSTLHKIGFNQALDSTQETDITDISQHMKPSAFSKKSIHAKRSSRNKIGFNQALDSTHGTDISDISQHMKPSAFSKKSIHAKRSSRNKIGFNQVLDSTRETDISDISQHMKPSAFSKKSIHAKRSSRNKIGFNEALDSTQETDISDISQHIKPSAFSKKAIGARRVSQNKLGFQSALDSPSESEICDQTQESESKAADVGNPDESMHNNSMNCNFGKETSDSKEDPDNVNLNESQTNTNVENISSRNSYDNSYSEEDLEALVLNKTPSDVAEVGNLSSKHKNAYNEVQDEIRSDDHNMYTKNSESQVNKTKSMTDRNLTTGDFEKDTSEDRQNHVHPIVISEALHNETDCQSSIDEMTKSEVMRDQSHCYSLLLPAHTSMQKDGSASGSGLRLAISDEGSPKDVSEDVSGLSKLDRVSLHLDYDSMLSSSDSEDESDRKHYRRGEIVSNHSQSDNSKSQESQISTSAIKSKTRSAEKSLSNLTSHRIVQLGDSYNSMEMTADSVLVECASECSRALPEDKSPRLSSRNRSRNVTFSNIVQTNNCENSQSIAELNDSAQFQNSQHASSAIKSNLGNGRNGSPRLASLRKRNSSQGVACRDDERHLDTSIHGVEQTKDVSSRESCRKETLNGSSHESISAASHHSMNDMSNPLLSDVDITDPFLKPKRPKRNTSKRGTPRNKSNKSYSKETSGDILLSELRSNKRSKSTKNDIEMLNRMITFPNSINNGLLIPDDGSNNGAKNSSTGSDVVIKVNKTPRLRKPNRWVTSRLYKFIIDKLDPTYGIKSRKRAEKFVVCLCNTVKSVSYLSVKEQYKEQVNGLMIEMARLKLIVTYYDFYIFVHEYLPHSFNLKSVPMLMPFGRDYLVEPLSPGTEFNSIL